MSVCLCVLSNGMFIDPLFSCTSVWAFMTNKIKLLDRFWDKTSQYMPGKSVRFTHRFRGRVFGIEIDHLGKVYWFWDKYSPLPLWPFQAYIESNNTHTDWAATITTTTVGSGAKTNPKTKPTLVDSPQTSFSALTTSLKPKPWHVVKKRGIVPDGLVQTHFNHFKSWPMRGGGKVE